MRIAVVSDIHGNLLALDAVMTDMERFSPDEVWCAGDLGWLGPWAGECIDRVRAAGWPTVKGNADVWITGDPQTVDDPNERDEFMKIAAAHDISEDQARWLLNLPLGHSGSGSMLMIHGTPQSAFDAPLPDAPPAEFSIYEGQAALVVYGHVHQGFVRRLSDGTIVANPGSVGIPLDDTTASYLLIDRQGANFTLRHRRVAYDRRGAIAQAQHNDSAASRRFLKMLGAE